MPIRRQGRRWAIGSGKARYHTRKAAQKAYRGYRARFNAR